MISQISKKIKIILLLTVLLLPTFVYSHGGGLDSYGCHNNRKQGGYHCHRGDNKGKSYFSKSEMLGASTTIQNKNTDNSSKLSEGDSYRGEVVSIADGDTLTILIDKKTYKIRLAQIDTPERKQPYGNEAKKVLSDLVFNKTISIKIETIDRYGRYVADIYLDRNHINAEMVKRGVAWVYQKYAKDEKLYTMENEAKAAKRGIWSLSENDQVPPWEWRKK